MRRLAIGLGLFAVIVAGIFAFFFLWPPTVRLVVLQKSAIPEVTRQVVMPVILDGGSGYALRAYGSGDDYEFVGYSHGKTHYGLFVFDLDGRRVAQGGDFETPFGVSESYSFSTITQEMRSYFAWGGAFDSRIARVIGTTEEGMKFEAAPENGFWWLWVSGSGRWAKFEAVSRAGRVLYTKESELTGK